jgi:hypothetical protein
LNQIHNQKVRGPQLDIDQDQLGWQNTRDTFSQVVGLAAPYPTRARIERGAEGAKSENVSNGIWVPEAQHHEYKDDRAIVLGPNCQS